MKMKNYNAMKNILEVIFNIRKRCFFKCTKQEEVELTFLCQHKVQTLKKG